MYRQLPRAFPVAVLLLAIFYRDFGYSSGLVRLGRIDSGIEKLAGKSGSFAVRFELVEEGR